MVLTRWDMPNISDATFRACFGSELPRAKALGYDVKPLRGKTQGSQARPLFICHFSRFNTRRTPDPTEVRRFIRSIITPCRAFRDVMTMRAHPGAQRRFRLFEPSSETHQARGRTSSETRAINEKRYSNRFERRSQLKCDRSPVAIGKPVSFSPGQSRRGPNVPRSV
jgi:hypothetical protein